MSSDLTDIPTEIATREERPDSCLHCVVMTAIEDWFERHGERRGGNVVIDVLLAVSKLTECVVQITETVPDRSGRRRAFRFAHDALDGNLKSQRAGKLVTVESPPEH
jgi:hypothetical protein